MWRLMGGEEHLIIGVAMIHETFFPSTGALRVDILYNLLAQKKATEVSSDSLQVTIVTNPL